MTNDRKHLTTREVEKFMAAAKGSRFEARDRCLLLMVFRHGLRVSEACGLELDQMDTESRVMHVVLLKKGLSTMHPLRADELRVIKACMADHATLKAAGRAFFVSQHRKPLTGAPHGLPFANMAIWRARASHIPAPIAPRLRLCP